MEANVLQWATSAATFLTTGGMLWLVNMLIKIREDVTEAKTNINAHATLDDVRFKILDERVDRLEDDSRVQVMQ